MAKRGKTAGSRRWLQIVGVVFLSTLFILPLVVPNTVSAPQVTVTPTNFLARPFPTVPPEGTAITLTGIYFHPSGLFSAPTIEGWNPPVEGAEESMVEGVTTRTAATFINSEVASVIHLIVDGQPAYRFASVGELDVYYTEDYVQSGWRDYTGGVEELGRGVQGDAFVIDFALTFNEQVYRARQITRLALDGTWLVTIRLVVPGNNVILIDRLQPIIEGGLRFWPQSLAAPLDWQTVADEGYMIRFPTNWRKLQGEKGSPYVFAATLAETNYRLAVEARDRAPVTTEDEARAFVTQTFARSQIQSVQILPGNAGFEVSFSDSDADGNRRSNLALMLNGPEGAETLYTAVLNASDDVGDLQSGEQRLAEISQILTTFFLTNAG